MLLRFLCSLKIFLNYVTDVYMYLKVIRGISYPQTLTFQREAREDACSSVGPSFTLYLSKRKSNRNRGFLVDECSSSSPFFLRTSWVMFSPLSLSSVPLPPGAVSDQPQRTWTVSWAKLSPTCVTGALEMRKQLGAGVLCGPCSFERATPAASELVPAELPLPMVTKETLPQGRPLQGACCRLPNSRFISPNM